MIVRSLRAEGFMRYELLELTDLPRGVIALVGENESGKSTIGEAIAFAIFGRTIRTEDTDPTQAIHWDADECRTQIEIELPGQGVFRIERRVARTGEFDARLVGPRGQEIAKGAREVGDTLGRVLGYDFSAFRYSFYVAQGELDLIQREGKDNASRVVCDMLGISTIDRASQRLEGELEELRERSSVLERDLIVANALHTESLPLRDEIAGYEQQLESAQESHRSAQNEESRAGEAYQRWGKAGQAQRDRADALAHLDRALVAEALRRKLLAARGRLSLLAKRADELAAKAEKAIALGARPREQAKATLAQAEEIQAAVHRLEALVAHRGQELARATKSGGRDTLPERQTREAAVAERERKSALWATVFASLFLLLAIGGGAVASLLQYPSDGPVLKAPPPVLVIPGTGIRFEDMSQRKATYAAAGFGALFLVLSVLALLRRRGAARRRRDAEEERGRLGERLDADRRELSGCEQFSISGLSSVSAAVAPIRDPQVQEAYEALRAKAGASMDMASTPSELLAQARKRVDEHDRVVRDSEPRLAEARRVAELASKALALLEERLGASFPEGLPPVSSDGELPADEGLTAAIEEASAEAAQVRVELDAVEAGAEVEVPAVPANTLQAAIELNLEALPGDQRALRERYAEQTGLPELLKQVDAREKLPTAEGVRMVVRRERELLDEVFGNAEQVGKQLREVEDQLRVARVHKAQAEAELQEVVARGARVNAGRKRLAELETKISSLEQVLRPTQVREKVIREAISLLEEVAVALKSRFGPGIARYIEVVLPRLTDGRYQRTRIDEDLDIRVYSPERGDYVRLIELSLGTADQILVSLRLGLARALLSSRGMRGGHFLFMDEPLVSADESREQAFFNLLRTFDDEFAQIFVTSPRRLSQDGPFAQQLTLTRSEKTVRLIEATA